MNSFTRIGFSLKHSYIIPNRILKREENVFLKNVYFNPLNPELNPICYLLALLAYHFLHVSRIRVKSLTLRLQMSYIYIYIYIWSAYTWCF